MTFELQHSDIPQAKLLDEEVTTTQWPMPPAKPWAPKSSIEQMCEEAQDRLRNVIEKSAEAHWWQHCRQFAIPHQTLHWRRTMAEFVASFVSEQ